MAVWAKRLESWCSWRSLIHLSSTSVLALKARAFWYDGCTGRICGGVDLAAFIFGICGLGYRGVWTKASTALFSGVCLLRLIGGALGLGCGRPGWMYSTSWMAVADGLYDGGWRPPQNGGERQLLAL